MLDIFAIKKISVPAHLGPDTCNKAQCTEWIQIPMGQIYGIEVKAKRGIQSESQKQWQKEFEKAGGIYILAYSLDDVSEILQNYAQTKTNR